MNFMQIFNMVVGVLGGIMGLILLYFQIMNVINQPDTTEE